VTNKGGVLQSFSQIKITRIRMSTHNTTATRATNVGDRAASPSAVHDHVCEFVAAQAEVETADCGGVDRLP
jgi:hypothetical protein